MSPAFQQGFYDAVDAYVRTILVPTGGGGLLAGAGGVDPRKINYIAYSGGGESLAALLGGKVAAGISGVGEYGPQVLSGDLKGLAVSSEERSGQVPDVPTITEAGYDVVLSNWRGLMSHPRLTPEARTALTDLVTAAHGTQEWRDVLAKNGFDASAVVPRPSSVRFCSAP